MPVEELRKPGVAHARCVGDGLPVATSFLQKFPYGDVYRCFDHPDTVAKLCSDRKQLIANAVHNTILMAAKSINRVLAENLAYFMDLRGFKSQNALAKKAGVSQRTVGYYLHPENRTDSKSGKESSAKLTELEKLARALGVQPWELLRDIRPQERELYGEVEDAYRKLQRRFRPTDPPSM